jgi:topoisomerase-4 subunit A
MELLKLTSREDAAVQIDYVPVPRLRVTQETIALKKFPVKSLKAAGIRLSPKKIKTAIFVKAAGKK